MQNKGYRYFTCNNLLVSILWFIATAVVVTGLLGLIFGFFSFWGIFSTGCVALAVIIINIITMVLLKYKIDYDGITVNASRKSRRFVPWNDLYSVEISYVWREPSYFVELKGDNVRIIFDTHRKIIEAIKEFSKNCDTFHRIFSECVEKAKQTGNAKIPTDEEILSISGYTKIFKSDMERLSLGGTGFYELQYCVNDLPINKLLYWKNINHWASNSLYIEALTTAHKLFNEHYDKIFAQFGELDYNGINYFTKEQTQKILCDLQNIDLPDIKILIDWLEICVTDYNGFYFLGV